jgi:2-methylcitrate dehydratase PrpD
MDQNDKTTRAFIETFDARYDYEALSDHVVEHAKVVLYDSLGALLSATAQRYPIGSLVEAIADDFGGNAEASVLGTDRRTNCTTAALLNGTLAYYGDIESHHAGANVHAIAVVAPSALAVAERTHSSGKAVLAAIVAGIDVAARVSRALGPAAQYARGFHPSTIAGTFGAATAAGRLLGLNVDQFNRAFGIAGNSTSGLLAWVDDPTEQSRPLNIGLAAQHGVQAALLAALGAKGCEDIFGGKYPLHAAFTGEWHEEALWADTGVYAIEEVFFKRFSTCVFIPAGVDGLLDIMDTENVSPESIESITVRAPRSAYHVIDNNPLRSHNSQYVLSVIAHQRDVQFDDIINDRREDPRIANLYNRISLVPDDTLDARSPGGKQSVGSITTVVTRDGSTYVRDIEFPRGAPENPLSPAEIKDKFHRLTTGVVTDERATEITTAVFGLDKCTDVRDFTRLLCKK